MSKGKRFSLLLLLAVAAIAVAACGSSSSNNSSSGASASQGAGSSSGGTIKFMTLAVVGSPVASYPEVQPDVDAAVAAINKAGGINGKKIQDIFCNSKGDANTAVTCAREAVKDKVAAVVGDIDLFNAQTTPVFAAAGIPVIGQWSDGDSSDGTNSDSFPINSGSFGSYPATIFAMKAMGIKKVAIVPLDFPIALSQAAVVQKTIAAEGLQYGGMIKVPVEGVSDYSPYAQQVKSSGAQGVVPLIGPAAFTGMQKALDSLGIKVTTGVCEICGETEPGLLLGGPYPPATDMSNPGIATFNKELVAAGLKQVSPTDINVYSGLNAWAAMHAAAEVAKTIKGAVTASSLTQALHHASNIDVEGLTTWSPSQLGSPALGKFPRFPVSQGYVLKIGAGGAIVNTGLPPITDPIKAGR
jgi:ABC-type branched-subunit amino acid transport system substrate-binding protein